MASEQLPVTVIQPRPPWSLPDPRRLWPYRDLLRLLIRRDLTLRYRQTLLGPIWLLLQPLALAGVFTLVFKVFASLPTDGRPAVLFYFSGLVGWSYVAQIVTSTAATFINNSELFSRVYFPRVVIPLTAASSGLLAVALQLVLFGFLTAAAGEAGPRYSLLLLPVIFLFLAMLALGVGLWIASTTAKYRDLSVATPFLLQLWFFATPIVYPLSSVPEDWRPIMAMLNPLAPFTEALRQVLTGAGSSEPLWLAVATLEIAAVFLTGILLFQRAERTVVDTV